MGLEHVPHDHIEVILRDIFEPGEDLAQLLRRAKVRDAAARTEILDLIEEHRPGTTARLADLWFFSHRRAIHLWLAPVFEQHTTASQLMKRRGYDKVITQPGWHNVDSGKRGQDRVLKISAGPTASILHVKTLLHVEHTFTDEDLQERKGLRAVPVDLIVNLGFETPLVEAHASVQAATKALFTFLDWALEAKLDRKPSPERDNLFRPLTFVESDIRLLAKRQHWDEVMLGGIDATKEVGELEMRGKLAVSGRHREPLNLGVSKVKAQNEAYNDTRAYNVYFEHEDGYREVAEVHFLFAARPPHITLIRGTSRTVVDNLIRLLNMHVARGVSR